MGGRSGARGRGASREGRLPDARRSSDFVRRFTSDEDRVRHRTTTSDSGFVARGVAPRVTATERAIEESAQQSGIESGELLGRDCSSDDASGHGGAQFSDDDESNGVEVDSDDDVHGDSRTSAVDSDDEACNSEGSEERAVEVTQGACTSEARPATASKSTPDNDVSRRSASRSPRSTSREDLSQTEGGKTEELQNVTPNLSALSTTGAESGQDPHSPDLPLNQEAETGGPPQQNHVSNPATSAVMVGERQSERVPDRSPTQDGGTMVGRGYREGSVLESVPAGDGSDTGGRRTDDPMVDACVISSVEGADGDKTNSGAVHSPPANTSGRRFVADLCNVGATANGLPEGEAVACGKEKGTAGACAARGEGGGRASEEGVLCKEESRYIGGKTRVSAEDKGDRFMQTGGTRRRRSPSPPTSSLSNCKSSSLRLREDTDVYAPRFGNDPLFSAAAHRRQRSNTAMSLPDRKTQVSSVFDPLTQKLEGARFEGDAPQNPPSSPPRGTKRRKSANITLAQVIDHHMARRRLNGVAHSADGLPTQRDSLGRSTTLGNTGSTKRKEAHNKSPAIARKQLADGSTVVAAAWANGCVLPLTATAAPHMRLVAPLLAAEPEGRRIVVRTASAVAAGVAVLVLPGYRSEVTGVCRDGLLMELSPKTDLQGERVRENGQSVSPSTLGNRLQAAFDKVVALDLEFDTVPLPHAEALDAMPPGSSSGELLKWRNDGTSALLYLARASSTQTGVESEEKRNEGNSAKGERRDGLPQLGEGCFLGIDNEMGPLLPRTGLLECFHVEIHPVPFPPSDSKAKGRGPGRLSTVNLAMVLSDSGAFRGGNGGGGSSVGRGEGRGQLPSGAVVTAPVTGGTGPNAAARSLRQLSARLCCVPPTRTEGGLAWRNIMGLKCVAEVSRLAFAPKSELEGKIQLVEGLHTAQVREINFQRDASGIPAHVKLDAPPRLKSWGGSDGKYLLRDTLFRIYQKRDGEVVHGERLKLDANL